MNSSDIDYLLECSICLERLDDHHKVLPCQHTFCIKCLRDVVKRHKGAGQYLCPECRTPCSIPLEELPSNVILNRILGGIAKQRNVPKNFVAESGPRKSYTSANYNATSDNSGSKQFIVPNSDNHNATSDNSGSKQFVPNSANHNATSDNSGTNHTASDNNDIKRFIPGNHSTNPFVEHLVPKLPPRRRPPLPPLPSASRSPAPPPVPRHGESSRGNQVYRALYDYAPVKSDELELKKRDLYIVSDKREDGWFRGSSVQTLKSGFFPGNFVMHVKFEKPASLKNGDLIDLDEEAEDNEADRTKILRNMEVFETTRNIVPPNVTTGKSAAARDVYRCVIPYPANGQYELDLKEGDLLYLDVKRDDGWCKGTLVRTGKIGLFPLTFVEKISSFS